MKKHLFFKNFFLIILAFVLFQGAQTTFAQTVPSDVYTIKNFQLNDYTNPQTGKDIFGVLFEVDIKATNSTIPFYKNVGVSNSAGKNGITSIAGVSSNVIDKGSYFNIPIGATGIINVQSLFDPIDLPQGASDVNIYFPTSATDVAPKPSVVNGVCGATDNVCNAGSWEDINDTVDAYKWKCDGMNGGVSAMCSQPIPPINFGLCGFTNNECLAGTSVDAPDTATNYFWSCKAPLGGVSDVCNLPVPITIGSCTGTLTPTNATVTRIKWKVSGISGPPGPYSYSWTGSPLPSDRSTTIPETDIDYINSYFITGKTKVVGPTLTITSKTTATAPAQKASVDCSYDNGAVSSSVVTGICGGTKNICTSGTLDDVDDTSANYLWNCLGSNGGKSASCSVAIPTNTKINAVCGKTNNSCSTGTFLSASSDVSWKCSGLNGGNPASCTASKTLRVDGQCSAVKNNCAAGVLSDIDDSGTNYLWNCDGLNGGVSDICSLPISKAGVCGDTKNTCAAGNSENIMDSSTSYLWNCKGVSGGISTACSLSKTVTTASVAVVMPKIPNKPTVTNGTACGGQVVVKWSDTAGATSYSIYRSETSAGTYSLLKSGISDLNYPDTQGSKKYYYKISASNSAGESAQSLPSSGSGTALCKITAPAKPTVVSGPACGGQITISWSPIDSAQSYNIYRNLATQVAQKIANGITSTTYVDSSSVPSGTVYYSVSTSGSDGQESARSTSAFAVASPVCSVSASANLSVSQVNNTPIQSPASIPSVVQTNVAVPATTPAVVVGASSSPVVTSIQTTLAPSITTTKTVVTPVVNTPVQTVTPAVILKSSPLPTVVTTVAPTTTSNSIIAGVCSGTLTAKTATVPWRKIKWTLSNVSGPAALSYEWSGPPLPAVRRTTIPETEIDYTDPFFSAGKTSVPGPSVKITSSGVPTQSVTISCSYNLTQPTSFIKSMVAGVWGAINSMFR